MTALIRSMRPFCGVGDVGKERQLEVGCSRTWSVVLACLLSALFAAPSLSGERSREIYTGRSRDTFVSKPGGSGERSLETYNSFMAGRGSRLRGKTPQTADAEDIRLAKELLTALFTKAAEGGSDPHKVVAFLTNFGLEKSRVSPDYGKRAEKKGYRNWRIDTRVAQLMGMARDVLVREAIVGIVRSNAEGLGTHEGRWKVARSDTGSVRSGVTADLDQAFHVFKYVDGEWVRAPELDHDFVEKLEAEWTRRNPELTLDMLKVVNIEGRHRLPDPRAYADVAVYRNAYLGALAGLRTTEGAHATFGGVVQSVDVRRREALEALGNPENPDAWRNRRVWQEFGFDPDAPRGQQYGELPVRDYSLAAETLLSGPSALLPDAAFGSAAAEYLALVRSYAADSFNAKYHLNVVDHALAAKARYDAEMHRPGTDASVDLPDTGRAELYRGIVSGLFGDVAPGSADAKRLADHVVALEVSGDLRRLHRGQAVKALQGRGATPHGEARDLAIFEPLLRSLYGEKYRPGEGKLAQWRTRRQLTAAKRYHRELATELAFEAVLKTAPDAFRALVDPEVVERCRPLLSAPDADWNATKVNYQEGVRLGLLAMLYDLDCMRRAKLIKRLRIEFPDKTPDLCKLALSHHLLPVRAMRANPVAYRRYAANAIRAFAAGACDHMLFELGFERLGDVELQGEIMRRQQLTWHPSRLVRNMFWDLGSIDAVAKIAETYFVSRGDWDAVKARALDELLLATPVVGKIVSVKRGGWTSAGLIVLSVANPKVGVVMVVISVGESTYRIYHATMVEPTESNVAQAVYSGYAGPDFSAYYAEPGKPTTVWRWHTDQALLESANGQYVSLSDEMRDLEDRLRDVRERLPRGDMSSLRRDPLVFRRWQRGKQEESRLTAQLASLRERFASVDAARKDLEKRKKAHEQLTEAGWDDRADPDLEDTSPLRRLSHSLLDVVEEPRFAFLGTAMVDRKPVYLPLERPAQARLFDPKWAQDAILDLRKRAEGARTIAEAVTARAELHELEFLQRRYERAQKYWERATKKNPWLLYRFRRDSLFDYCREHGLSAKDLADRADAFLKTKDQEFFEELVRLGLLEMTPAARRPEGLFISKSRWTQFFDARAVPAHIKTRLKKRLAADHLRSRTLIEIYEKLESHRHKARKAAVAKHIKALQNEAFTKAAIETMSEERFGDLLVALRFSGVRRLRPIVHTRFYRTLKENKELRGGRAGTLIPPDGANVVHASAYVYADDTIYLRPWRLETAFLKKQQLASLGDRVGGRPLLRETAAAVRELKEKHAKEIEDGSGMIGVATVLAKGLGDLKGALSSTIKDLPGVTDAKGPKGEVIMDQQAAFVPLEKLKILVEPIRVVVRDQAGTLIVGGEHEDKLAVTIAGKHPMKKAEKFWSTHQFTKYGETIDIVAAFKMSDGTQVTATRQLCVNDLESWLEPQPPEVIEITLPIFLPENFVVRGIVAAEPPKNPQTGRPMPVPKEASVANEFLGISGRAKVSRGGGTGPAGAEKDAFQIPVKGILRVGATVELTARGSAPGNLFQATAAKPLPERAGTIDFGIITLRPATQTVRVPDWSKQNPPGYSTYAARLSALGLVGKPKLGKPTSETRLQYKVLSTSPSAGTEVQTGTSVVVVLHDKFAPRVPDVVGLHVGTATKKLADCGFAKVTTVIGGEAASKKKEFTVSHQSVKPGTEHPPDGPIKLTLLGRFVAKNVVPDLRGLTESEAREAVRRAQLRLEVADRNRAAPSADDAGHVYRQQPRAKSLVGADTAVRAWLFAGRGGEGDGQERGGAFYVAFRWTVCLPKGERKLPELEIKIPKGNYNKNQKLAVQAMVRAWQSGIDQLVRAIDGWGEGAFEQKEAPPEAAFILHVDNRALGKYPRSLFQTGAKFSCPVRIEVAADDEKASYEMGYLLKADTILNSLEAVKGRYAEMFAKPDLLAMLLVRTESREGTATAVIADEKLKGVRMTCSLVFGPVTQGWSKSDVRRANRFLLIERVMDKVFSAAMLAGFLAGGDEGE